MLGEHHHQHLTIDHNHLTIDHNLYSRQIGAYGVEAMGKLVALRVFIYGLRGLGIETAKNLILAGPKQVVLQDNHLVELKDLGSNFYCHESDVGKKTRAEASLHYLKPLNSYVDVTAYDGEITHNFLHQFDIVVFTDFYDAKKLLDFNQFCRTREKPIGFIYAGSLGLYGFTFVDFGPHFNVLDKDGEDPKSSIIAMITNDNPGQVAVHDDKRHGFVDGDYVRFREVEGMPEINGKEYYIKVISPIAFTIDQDTTNWSKYIRNGVVEQIKVPQIVKFKSLAESLVAPLRSDLPPLENPDLEKWGRPDHLHIGLNAILAYSEEHRRLPRLNNEEDAAEFLKIYERVNSNVPTEEGTLKAEEINQELVKNIARYSQAQTTCHSAFFGGIVAQEVVKFIGKFMPLRQWLHYDNFELLPEGNVDRTPANSRYDDQIAIFGREFQEQLMNKKLFLVGAGALGCEFIKQFALAGLGCGPKGKLVCTDDDNIEISNLNRQFLFRKENVGHSKAQVACEVGHSMNKDLHVEALKLRVSPENENVFSDEFWEGLDIVTNAVDNIKARQFVDSRCVFYGKPLFESGTLGTKCNSQIIIPFKTESYSDSQDPEEEGIPLCTLKNFPYLIEHTIQWARDLFEGVFVEGPNEYIKYAEDPHKYLSFVQKEHKRQPNVLRSKLETVYKIANHSLSNDPQVCLQLAREMFQEIFHNQIAQLIHTFPEDAKNDAGQHFWSSHKRFPKVVNFHPDDSTHVHFIISTANLWSYVFNHPPLQDKRAAAIIAAELPVETFKPKKVVIKENENDTREESAEDDDVRIAELIKELTKLGEAGLKPVNTMNFEKDDDTNYHIDYISSVANLRARNYNIEEVSRMKVKLIAGKIIPAIATTTAMIVGAVGFEIFKYVAGKKIETFRNAFCNLAVPLWVFSEPLPAVKMKDKDYDVNVLGPIKAIPNGFTAWDMIEMQGPKTLEEISAFIKEKYGVNITLQEIPGHILYSASFQSHKQRLKLTPEEAYQQEKGEPVPPHKKYIQITASGDTDDGIDAIIPVLKYQRA